MLMVLLFQVLLKWTEKGHCDLSASHLSLGCVKGGGGGVADGRCWATLASYIQSEEVFEGGEDRWGGEGLSLTHTT